MGGSENGHESRAVWSDASMSDLTEELANGNEAVDTRSRMSAGFGWNETDPHRCDHGSSMDHQEIGIDDETHARRRRVPPDELGDKADGAMGAAQARAGQSKFRRKGEC